MIRRVRSAGDVPSTLACLEQEAEELEAEGATSLDRRPAAGSSCLHADPIWLRHGRRGGICLKARLAAGSARAVGPPTHKA